MSIVTPWCDEVLPPRENIDNIMKPSIASVGYLEQTGGKFYTTFYLILTNTTDETIQDYAVCEGSIELEWLPDPINKPTNSYLKRIYNFTRKDLQKTSRGIDNQGKLTIAPYDTVSFLFQWDWRNDNEEFLPDYIRFTQDLGCLIEYNSFSGPVARKITRAQDISVKAKVRLFSSLGQIVLDKQIVKACYVIPYHKLQERNLSSSPCKDVNSINPCSLVE